MQVFVKRAKIFMDDSNGSHRRVTLAKMDGPQLAPDWIRTAPGYKESVKDGSLIDLSPLPEPRHHGHASNEEVTKPSKSAESNEDNDAKDDDDVDDDEETLKKKMLAAETKTRKPKGIVTSSAKTK